MNIKLTEGKGLRECDFVGKCFTTKFQPNVVFLVLKENDETCNLDCLILSSDKNNWRVGDFLLNFSGKYDLVPWHGKIEIEV